jgi:hypothetical protein
MFLLLGAIVNVAVAWGCVHASHPTSLTTVDEVREYLGIQRREAPTACEARPLGQFGWVPRNNTHLDEYHVIATERKHVGCVHRHLSEEWSFAQGKFATYYPSYPSAVAIMSSVRAGWPVKSMHGEVWSVFDGRTGAPGTRRDGIIEFPRTVNMVNGSRYFPVQCPLDPIWPGFAINTLFYAGLLWLLFAAPFALRRRRRMKRGLCPVCAYPVGESEVCTECGKPVKGRTVESDTS